MASKRVDDSWSFSLACLWCDESVQRTSACCLMLRNGLTKPVLRKHASLQEKGPKSRFAPGSAASYAINDNDAIISPAIFKIA